MKKTLILLPFAALFLMTSCSTDPKAKAKKNIEAEILPQMNDPKSYEFVSLDLNTFLTETDSIKAANVGSLKFGSKKLEEAAEIETSEFKKQVGRSDATLAEKHYLDSLTSDFKGVLKEERMKFLKAATSSKNDSTIIAYKATISYRAKNQFGAIVPGSNTFTLDKNFNLVAGPSLHDMKASSEKWDEGAY